MWLLAGETDFLRARIGSSVTSSMSQQRNSAAHHHKTLKAGYLSRSTKCTNRWYHRSFSTDPKRGWFSGGPTNTWSVKKEVFRTFLDGTPENTVWRRMNHELTQLYGKPCFWIVVKARSGLVAWTRDWNECSILFSVSLATHLNRVHDPKIQRAVCSRQVIDTKAHAP